jgi:iron-sulfur cluster assembly protein
MITITDKAASKVKEFLAKQGKSEGAVRIQVKGGGCSGMQYQFSLVDSPRTDDAVTTDKGVKVCVDPKSAVFLEGAEVDFVEAFINGGFKVRNPNAAGSCSCGESFSA